ncbi:MAG TPA: DNA alkylation repair protein [Vicinamibacterales bacterium]
MHDAVELSKVVRRDLARLPKQDATSVRMVRRRHARALERESPEVVLEFVRLLLKNAGWAERVVAWEILASNPLAVAHVDDQLAEEMAEGLSDWGSVDLYAVTVLGRAWRDGQVRDSLISAWARSADRWRRRLALVATVPLNSRARGGDGDVRRTLRVCRVLVADRDDMVVKAMSWALRELAKRAPIDVARFLRREEDRLAARVKREVLNKLTTNLKNPGRLRRRSSTV